MYEWVICKKKDDKTKREETSEKSKELEGKCQGTLRERGYPLLQEKCW